MLVDSDPRTAINLNPIAPAAAGHEGQQATSVPQEASVLAEYPVGSVPEYPPALGAVPEAAPALEDIAADSEPQMVPGPERLAVESCSVAVATVEALKSEAAAAATATTVMTGVTTVAENFDSGGVPQIHREKFN